MSAFHPLERAKERYGLDLDWADLRAIADVIKRGMAVQAETQRQPNRLAYAVVYQGVTMRVVYDHATDSVITFLPREERASGYKPPNDEWRRWQRKVGGRGRRGRRIFVPSKT